MVENQGKTSKMVNLPQSQVFRKQISSGIEASFKYIYSWSHSQDTRFEVSWICSLEDMLRSLKNRAHSPKSFRAQRSHLLGTLLKALKATFQDQEQTIGRPSLTKAAKYPQLPQSLVGLMCELSPYPNFLTENKRKLSNER